MDRYEQFLLRTYALRALRQNCGRVGRPNGSLAEWLFEHAAALGFEDPKINADQFYGRGSRVDNETWAAFGAILNGLKRAVKNPPPSAIQRRIGWLCDTLGLGPIEADILHAGTRAALDQSVLGLLGASGDRAEFCGSPTVCGYALLTGHSERTVKVFLQPEKPLRLLGLLEEEARSYAPSKIVLRVARMTTTDPDRMRTALVGRSRKPELTWEDFTHLGEVADLAERTLAGALANRAHGVNILLYGYPGTGKTEFVRTLAGRLGAHPLFVGEADDKDGEPSRGERIAAFAIARSMTTSAGRTLLVVDEADDIFIGVDEQDGGSRRGSKVFMNRLVESTPCPTIWITNHRERLGEAVLRRMALAVRFPEPGRVVRRRVVERIARRRRLRLPEAALDRLAQVRASPAVMDSALRVAKLTRGGNSDVERAARSVVYAIRGAPAPPALGGVMAFDPALSEADHDLAALAERLSGRGETALSFCLHGLPGTGKSAYARYLAERMGLDVIEKRASDLLSMWLGESEKQIARMFEEAADRRALLILDEADSLLRDRAGARASWEVTQVNEMLTWMERHPYPFACTTNLMESLDPATLRRFLFKIRFLPLRPDQACETFRRSFGVEAPRALATLDNLAPGDFAVVARKAALLGVSDPPTLTRMLEDELATKAGGIKRRIGF